MGDNQCQVREISSGVHASHSKIRSRSPGVTPTSECVLQAIAAIKSDGSKWVSKYARGGSARKQSARKFYIVVDSIQGHFVSNGCGSPPV